MDAGIWLVSFWFIWVESFRKSFFEKWRFDVHHSLETTKPNCFCWIRNLVFLITRFNTTLHNEEFGPTNAAWTEQIVAPKSKILTCFFFGPARLEAFDDDGRFLWWEVLKKNVGSKEGKGCLFPPCLFSACLSMCSWSFLGSFLLSSLFWAPPRLGVSLAKSNQKQ